MMVLRYAGLVTANRDGRIFYRLVKPGLFEAICQVTAIAGVYVEELPQFSRRPLLDCPCLRSNPDMDPQLACKKIKVKRL